MNFTIDNKVNKSFLQILILLLLLFLLSAFNATPANAVTKGDEGDSDIEKPTDKEITSFIEMELIVEDGVDWNDIDVETIEGIVTMSGTVQNMLEKDRSVNIAKSIKGVRGVVDQIEVSTPDIPDDELRRNVKAALLLDPATDSYELDIKASDGKVTLSGKVNSWQEKQLAQKVVKGVQGVKEVENNIYFDFTRNRKDSEIKYDIVQTLHWDIRVDDSFIDVEVKNGKVNLSGMVGSVSEQSQAVVDAWVSGVRYVNDDELIISPWSDYDIMREDKYADINDEAIKKAVKDAFLYDPRVLSFNPEVSVKQGKVTLTGVVDNLKAKRAAEIDARNVVGVWKVDNLLKVRGDFDLKTDQTILENVRQVLSLNPYLNEYDISVAVDNGVITLDGYVENYLEKYEAGSVSSAIFGVKDVKNKIDVAFDALPYAYDYNDWFYLPYSKTQVNPHTPVRSDWEIENNIESQLWWSPFVDLGDITVEVDNGIARLEGNVDSWREYYVTEKNAYEGGALGVDNDLEVQQ